MGESEAHLGRMYPLVAARAGVQSPLLPINVGRELQDLCLLLNTFSFIWQGSRH